MTEIDPVRPRRNPHHPVDSKITEILGEKNASRVNGGSARSAVRLAMEKAGIIDSHPDLFSAKVKK